jgi:hypothetical protein
MRRSSTRAGDTADDEGRRREKTATSRRVQTKITEMHERRADFLRSLQAGSPQTTTILAFQTSLVELAEALRPFRDQADHRWQTAGPDGFEDLLDRLPTLTAATTTTGIETVGFGRKKRVTREEPQTLDDQTLLTLSHDLDDIAREIGFETEPEQSADNVHGGAL